MRTLFTKILLWFLLTVVVTFGDRFMPPTSSFRTGNPISTGSGSSWAKRARHGKRRARPVWRNFSRITKTGLASDAFLTDGAGRDLITGRDWSGDIHASIARGRGPFPIPFVRIDSRPRYLRSRRCRRIKNTTC